MLEELEQQSWRAIIENPGGLSPDQAEFLDKIDLQKGPQGWSVIDEGGERTLAKLTHVNFHAAFATYEKQQKKQGGLRKQKEILKYTGRAAIIPGLAKEDFEPPLGKYWINDF